MLTLGNITERFNFLKGIHQSLLLLLLLQLLFKLSVNDRCYFPLK